MALPPIRAEEAGDVAQDVHGVVTQGTMRVPAEEHVPAEKEGDKGEETIEIPGGMGAVHGGLLMSIGGWREHPAQHLFEALVNGALFLEHGANILGQRELMRGNVDEQPNDGIAIEGFHTNLLSGR